MDFVTVYWCIVRPMTIQILKRDKRGVDAYKSKGKVDNKRKWRLGQR